MTHRCHAIGCDSEVPPALLMCRRHWFLVPKPLRQAVWRLYRRGQERDKNPSAEYLEAAKAAIAAVAEREAGPSPRPSPRSRGEGGQGRLW